MLNNQNNRRSLSVPPRVGNVVGVGGANGGGGGSDAGGEPEEVHGGLTTANGAIDTTRLTMGQPSF